MRGRRRMTRPRGPSKGVVGKGLKRKKGQERGERGLLYSSKAAAGPCTRLAQLSGR